MDQGARAGEGKERGSGREIKFPICGIVQSRFELPSYSAKCLSYVCNFRNVFCTSIFERVMFKNEEER